MQACTHMHMEQEYGLKMDAMISCSLSWRVSEGGCVQPLPWRYHPRKQPTQAPSCLCPAPPPPSGLQRWPSESLDQCHAMSAGPPVHRWHKLQCCTCGTTHSSTNIFCWNMASVPTHYIHHTYCPSCPTNITNMYRFMIKSLCVPAEREPFSGAPWPPALVLFSS